MYDILITGGMIPDFTTKTFVKANVAVKDGKIEAVLPEDGFVEAARVIDASGKVVSPGFIDMHSHEEVFPDGSTEFDVSKYYLRQGITTGICGNCGIEFNPVSYVKKVYETNGGGYINYVPLAGYNSFRDEYGFGWYGDVPADVRAEIIEKLRAELEDGAWGFSFGLEYCPGISTEEMTDAVMALKEYDPLISIHFRADTDKCLDSVHEIADLSKVTGCRVELSHIGSLAAVGGNMRPSLDIMNEEMSANPRLGFDVYPYNAFCTEIGSAAFDMDWRAKWNCGYDIIMPLCEPYMGMRCDEALYNKILKEQPEANVVAFALDEADVRLAIADPNGFYGTDGGMFPGMGSHPRTAGSFPRILGKYVREEKLLPLIDALEKLTIRPAAFVGLPTKGDIRPGMDADITIFDPDTILDGATFLDTSLPNVGIDYVIVAGKVGCDHNELTGELGGELILRN
ncbi:MAG: amidohydrolase family protein [Eubacterium sp.]|nr:amidohydrolase family protein [Eubacterium sp.]